MVQSMIHSGRWIFLRKGLKEKTVVKVSRLVANYYHIHLVGAANSTNQVKKSEGDIKR